MGARIHTRDTPPLESIARVQRADQPGLEDDDHKSQSRLHCRLADTVPLGVMDPEIFLLTVILARELRHSCRYGSGEDRDRSHCGVVLYLCMERAELAVSWSVCGARTRARHKFFSMLVRSFWVATEEHNCVSERACLHSGERAV